MVTTVLRGWPAGSLLMMRAEPSFFGTRPFEFVPDDGPADPRWVVLDGQQRLSALYQAFRDRGPYVYALDFRQLIHDDTDDVDQAIVSFARDDWLSRYPTLEAHWDAGLIPLPELASSRRFFQWRSSIQHDEATADRLADLYSKHFGAAESYDFPVVELDPYLEHRKLPASSSV